jgi:hypothetical protein
MSSFFITKITWEYGERYGHVFYPNNITAFQHKIQELHRFFEQKQQPSMVAISFTDPTLYLGFSVGYELSCIEFSCHYNEQRKVWTHPCYLKNDCYSEEDFIIISYFSSESYIRKNQFFSYKEVFDGIFYFIENRRFPKNFIWDSPEDMNSFITTN